MGNESIYAFDERGLARHVECCLEGRTFTIKAELAAARAEAEAWRYEAAQARSRLAERAEQCSSLLRIGRRMALAIERALNGGFGDVRQSAQAFREYEANLRSQLDAGSAEAALHVPVSMEPQPESAGAAGEPNVSEVSSGRIIDTSPTKATPERDNLMAAIRRSLGERIIYGSGEDTDRWYTLDPTLIDQLVERVYHAVLPLFADLEHKRNEARADAKAQLAGKCAEQKRRAHEVTKLTAEVATEVGRRVGLERQLADAESKLNGLSPAMVAARCLGEATAGLEMLLTSLAMDVRKKAGLPPFDDGPLLNPAPHPSAAMGAPAAARSAAPPAADAGA